MWLFFVVTVSFAGRSLSVWPKRSHGWGGEEKKKNTACVSTWPDLISAHCGTQLTPADLSTSPPTGRAIKPWRPKKVTVPTFCNYNYCGCGKYTTDTNCVGISRSVWFCFWCVKDARTHYPWLSALMPFQGNKTFAYQINSDIISTTMSYMQALFKTPEWVANTRVCAAAKIQQLLFFGVFNLIAM